jgi:hypothetical protein
MANHVQNVLLVEGQATQAVRKYVQRPENLFDFTTILPLSNASLEEKIRCWGTKENAMGAVFHKEDGSFSFQTLNAPPLPVIEQLSKKFPNCTFTLRWADEGGGICGEAAYRNGYEQYSLYPADGTRWQEELYELCWGQPMYIEGVNQPCKN